MNCQQCNKEFEAKRKTAKYCSTECRKLAFLKRVDSVAIPQKNSVPVISVTKYFSKVVGTGICHGCGRKFMEIPSQWNYSDKFGVPDENLANKMCICLDCLDKGLTHESLGLDIADCEKKNVNLNSLNPKIPG